MSNRLVASFEMLIFFEYYIIKVIEKQFVFFLMIMHFLLAKIALDMVRFAYFYFTKIMQ